MCIRKFKVLLQLVVFGRELAHIHQKVLFNPPRRSHFGLFYEWPDEEWREFTHLSLSLSLIIILHLKL